MTPISCVPGARFTRAWAEQKIVWEIMVFLQSHGVGTSRAVRIFKTYGADAIPLVTENPYRLARDIRGIGFRTADTIAERLGIPKDSMIRARAGVSYALLEAVSNGHCGLSGDELLTLAGDLLDIPQPTLAEAVRLEIAEGSVVADTVKERRCIFLMHLWHAEREIADRLTALADGEPSLGGDRRRQGHPLGGGEARHRPGGQPEGGGDQGAGLQGSGGDRRPRRR